MFVLDNLLLAFYQLPCVGLFSLFPPPSEEGAIGNTRYDWGAILASGFTALSSASRRATSTQEISPYSTTTSPLPSARHDPGSLCCSLGAALRASPTFAHPQQLRIDSPDDKLRVAVSTVLKHRSMQTLPGILAT